MHLPNLYASIHSFISAEYKPFYGSKYVVFVSANKFSWSEANIITKVRGLLLNYRDDQSTRTLPQTNTVKYFLLVQHGII